MLENTAETIDRFNTLKEKILQSEIQVNVNSVLGPQKTTLKALINQAQQDNKLIIFTFTPGPFKPGDKLPTAWMDTNAAKGCTPQLNAFEKNFSQLNAIVVAINKQTDDYQCGTEGLLAKKGYHNLLMISDAKNELQKAFDLPVFKLDKEYLERFSVLIAPNNTIKIFTLTSPVNDTTAEQHIQEIKDQIAALNLPKPNIPNTFIHGPKC